MSAPIPVSHRGAAIGLDHVGIVGADLEALARAFLAMGFRLTTRAGGRIANRCVMLSNGGYLELMATVPGRASVTLDRLLDRGPGAHILALEVDDDVAAVDRPRRKGPAVDAGGVAIRFISAPG